MSNTEYAATFEAPDLGEIARLFPTYDVHALIACGGMGAVYQATQRSLERVVAIKILPREFSADEEFRKGFEAEAKAMAKLNHPNLIGVFDFGEVDQMLFLVMEYVHGKSLFHSAHGQAIDQTEALRIISQVCAGLEHAHANGILHRDIKPGNILLDPNASPKIGDFGLARALENQIQDGEQIFGTPGYTAPEVLSPPFTFDQRADVYSTGVMLHELLTGKLPGEDPRPASAICRCNAKLDRIIKRATEPDPALRYSTADQLREDLEKIVTAPTSGLVTAPPSASFQKIYAPPKYAKKQSSPVAGFFFFLLTIGVLGGGYFWLKKNNLLPGIIARAKEMIQPGSPPETSVAPRKLDVAAFFQKARAEAAASGAQDQSSAYLTALRVQLKLSQTIADAESTTAIQTEIDRVTSEADYFRSLLGN